MTCLHESCIVGWSSVITSWHGDCDGNELATEPASALAPSPLGCLLKSLASRDLCLFSFLGSNAKLASLPEAGEGGSESSLLKFLLLILLLSTWPALQWHSAPWIPRQPLVMQACRTSNHLFHLCTACLSMWSL